MFVGVLMYSFIIGTLSSIILSRDSRAREIEKKLNTLIEIRQKFDIDSHTFNKVKRAIKQGYNRNDEDKVQFLNELPVNLRTKVIVPTLQGSKPINSCP